MTKPRAITKKQTTIISLLFCFRFLDRVQIQKFLKHKDEARINNWLKDLTEKDYISRSYTKTFPENTKPAVYHIAKKGIAQIKSQNNDDPKLVQKLYREDIRSASFVSSCLILADIYLDLLDRTNDEVVFQMFVKSDYSTHPQATLLNDLSPSAYIEQSTAGKVKCYFLEVLADLPDKQSRQRIKKYLNFYQSNEWEGVTGQPFPTVLIICPDDKILAYVKHFAMTKLALLDEPELAINLATAQKAKELGIVGDIWTKVNRPGGQK